MFYNAIVSTLIIISLSLLLSIIVNIAAWFYLREQEERNYARFDRLLHELLGVTAEDDSVYDEWFDELR